MIRSRFGVGRDRGDPKRCVDEAVREFEAPKLILFSAGEAHFAEYAALLHERFPGAVSMGCTGYRAWGPWGTEKDVLNVMAVEDGVRCAAGVIARSDNFALESSDCVQDCVKQIGALDNTICVEFTMPYRNGEEFVLMALNSVLLRDEVPIVGGSAANTKVDTMSSQEAYLALNGKIHTDGAVFVLIHSEEGAIRCYKENIYEPLTGRELLVTKANIPNRTILAFDERPAAQVYAEELGVPVEQANDYVFHNPLGRRIGDETYITAVMGRSTNDVLACLARVHEGSKIMVLKEGDFRAITRETVRRAGSETADPSLVLMFNCIARTAIFEGNGYVDEYQKLLSEAFPDFICFDCLGEQTGTKHFNHTLMMVVFE